MKRRTIFPLRLRFQYESDIKCWVPVEYLPSMAYREKEVTHQAARKAMAGRLRRSAAPKRNNWRELQRKLYGRNRGTRADPVIDVKRHRYAK